MKMWITCAVLLAVSSLTFAQPKPLELRGKIDSVTVYRGQALVARVVDVPAPGGLREIVVTDLPPRIVPSSVFAESMNGVEIRSVLFRERAVDKDVREEVRKLDEAIRDVQDLTLANQRAMQTLTEQMSYLNKLETFVAPTAQVELTKGVLNAETIKGLTSYQFEQRNQIAANELKLRKEARDLGERLHTLQRQRAELTGGSARTVREAVVFANLPEAGGRVRVRYLVDAATWHPSYNVRGERDAKQVTLEYNASIQQMSGEDWTDVQMTLSTATPSLVATAPTLDTLSVSLQSLPRAGEPVQGGQSYTRLRAEIEQRKMSLNYQRSSVNTFATTQPSQGQSAAIDTERLDHGLNEIAREQQFLEILAKDIQARDRNQGVPAETVSVTYQLANRTSLPSRQDLQLIQVASTRVKSDFYKLAAPVLSSYVYDQATLTNDSPIVLLAGPVASFMSGQFVGGGQIPTVAIGETFSVGFGVDSSLRATRELISKTESTQGGNKVLNFIYQLSVENFGANPAIVRLTDRMPLSKENDLKIQLVESSRELSIDATYRKNDHKNNLLRWDVSVDPQSIGPKAASVQYKYQLEFDRQMTIVGMPVAAK